MRRNSDVCVSVCVCECVCVCDYVYVSKSLCVCECVNECSCQLHSTNLVVLRQCYHVFTVDQLSSCVFPEVSTMTSYTSVQSKSSQAEMICQTTLYRLRAYYDTTCTYKNSNMNYNKQILLKCIFRCIWIRILFDPCYYAIQS